MSMLYRKREFLRRGAVSLLLLALFVSVTTVLAYTFVTIDTDDGHLNDWADVPLFQTDPEDLTLPQELDLVEDMIVYVDEDGDGVEDHIAFCAEMRGGEALIYENHAVVAILDCDNDNVENDREDRIIAYFRDGDYEEGGYIGSDSVYVYSGDLDGGFPAGADPDENVTLGEPHGSIIEWQAPLIDLRVFQDDPENYCIGGATRDTGDIPISFMVAEASVTEVCPFPPWYCYGQVSMTALDTTDSELPPDPTAIDLYALQVQAPETISFLSLSLLFAALCLLTGVAVLRVQRRQL